MNIELSDEQYNKLNQLAEALRPFLSVTTDNGDISDPPDTQALTLYMKDVIDLPNGWKRTNVGIKWASKNYFNEPGNGVIPFAFEVTEPARYELRGKTRSVGGEDKTENNDSWFYFNGKWHKLYQHGNGQWVESLIDDKTKKPMQFDLPTGSFFFDLSGRSKGHEIESLYLVKVSDVITQPGNKSKLGPKDFVSIHGDFRPDKDDGHAAVVHKMIIDHFGLEDQMMYVCGTYAPGSPHKYNDPSKVLNAVFGTGNWYNAHTNRDEVVAIAAKKWDAIIENGGHVYVADGGPMSFTADVLLLMKQDTKSVTVVQHSNWNKNQDRNAEQFIKKFANYRKVDDGNHTNNTVDLNSKLDDAVIHSLKAHPTYGIAWTAAFEYYPPNKRADASDGAATADICDPDSESLNDWGDFLERYL